MKVALYGATGNAGSRILKELAARGHQITAIVRDPANHLRESYEHLCPGLERLRSERMEILLPRHPAGSS